MAWFKVDDNLAMHAKVVRAGNAAMGLWVRAGSWSAQQLTDGFVPEHMVAVLGTIKQAERLVKAGLWLPAEDKGVAGFLFHEWKDRQPTKNSVEQRREYERDKKRAQRRDQGGRFTVPTGHDGDNPGSPPGSPTVPARPGPSRPVSTYVGTPAAVGDASDEPPAGDPHPQPEMQNVPAVLQAAGLAHHEVRDFLVDLKGTGARSTSALVSSLHRSSKLAGRIAEWRTERDLATEASTRRPTGKRTTDDKVRDGLDLARRLSEGAEVVPIRQIEGA